MGVLISFIKGPGLTSKAILAYDGNALTVVSSGIASTLADGGRTSHSRFKFPIDILKDDICKAQASRGRV